MSVSAAALLLTAAVLGGLGPAATGAPAVACAIDPQLNQVTISQGMPYARLARGKETLVRLYFSLPTTLPNCAKSGSTITGAIRINAATLTAKNAATGPALQSPAIAAQPEAVGAQITNTAPTSRAPAVPVNAPSDPKFAVPGSVLAQLPATTEGRIGFDITVRYQSKGNDGTFTVERSRTFSSFTPPGGVSTPISKTVEQQTRTLRVLVVPMGGQLTADASSAVAAGMTNVSRAYPLPDGTNGTATTSRTADLTSTAGVLRYTIDSGVVDLTGLTGTDGLFCGLPSNFTTIQLRLMAFRNAWNGVVNGVDSPQEQDADKVVGVVPATASTADPARGCLNGYAMTNSNEAWIRALPDSTGALFGMELCHTFGCVADSGTFHSVYTNADTTDPDRAYNVISRSFLQDDHTVMKSVNPWTNDNTVMEPPHFSYLLCGLGGANTGLCPAAPFTGTLTGVASGPTVVVYGTTDGTVAGTDASSMLSNGAPETVPDPNSRYTLVQVRTSGGEVSAGVPVQFQQSAHIHDGSSAGGSNRVGTFNVAFDALADTRRIELRFDGTVLYSRDLNAAPTVSASTTPPELLAYKPALRRWGRAGSVRSDSLPAPVATVPYRSGLFSGFFGYRSVARTLDATTYTVNSLNDPGVGVCDGDECTLREAILASNLNVGRDTIAFNIPAPRTIKPAIPLPLITDAVVIDGTTQPEFAGAPVVELDGSALIGSDLLAVRAEGTTIRGLVINRVDGSGISIFAGTLTGETHIETNYIGIDRLGGTDLGNGYSGINVSGAHDVVIGGPNPAQRNVISGNDGFGVVIQGSNARNNAVFGNHIGTDAGGNFAVGNGTGVCVCTTGTENVRVGDAVPGDGNVISGNGFGVELRSSGSGGGSVQGNYIGTSANGLTAVPNARGIFINQSSNHLVGGTGSRTANVISANGIGISIHGSSGAPASANTIQGNVIGLNSLAAPLGNTGAGIDLIGTSPGNLIGGDVARAGNVVSANGFHGIFARDSSTGTTIKGNFVGTSIDGTADAGNAADGIRVETNGNVIGGTSPLERNLVSGNTGHGVLVYRASDNVVQGNYVGSDVFGTNPLGNGMDGVIVDGGTNNKIGSGVAGGGNLIVANFRQGATVAAVSGTAATGNFIQGNRIGVGADGSTSLGNDGDGVRIHNASGTKIGGESTNERNTIWYSGAFGVAIFSAPPSAAPTVGNDVQRNSIKSSEGIGIDLGRDGVTANDIPTIEGWPDTDTGANELQNFPTLTLAEKNTDGSTRIRGSLASTPSKPFRLDFYSSPACDTSGNGEGETWIGWGTATTDASGFASIDTASGITAPTAVGEVVTATATDENGNTSEFSRCRTIIAAGPPGTTHVFVDGTDELPGDTRTFVFIRCGDRQQPLFVDLKPSRTSGQSFSSDFNFDPAPACGVNGNATLTVVATDGLRVSEPATVTVASPNSPPAPAITSGSDFLQWDGINLVGYAFDGEEQLADAKLEWTSPLFAGTRTGFTVPLSPPAGGWTPGSYVVTLKATDTPGLSRTVTKTITIGGDADHDGWQTGSDPNDNNPRDAYQDCDGDGFFNVEDPAMCVPATSYPATADFQPDPFVLPYSGNATMVIKLLNRNPIDIDPATVRITSVDGNDVSTDSGFKATNVAVTSTGFIRATFNGTYLSNWLIAHDIHDRRIVITVAGRSATTPAWTFEGSDTTYVKGG